MKRGPASDPDQLEQRVLRSALEPSAVITDTEVHRALTLDPAGYFRFIYDSLCAIAAGELEVEMPPKQLFSDPGALSDFRVMPCVTRSADRTTKTVKLVGTNIAQHTIPDQITVGKALVIDPVENYVTHIVDACLLSSARTGLCAALAIQLLAVRRDRLVVIGSGRVGYYAAFYAAKVCGIRQIEFTDSDPARASAAATALNARIPGICRASSKDKLESPDIVVIATTSHQPVCSPPAWGASLVVSLGADIDHQSELDATWAGAAAIYADTPDSMRFGDLKKWLTLGLLQPESVTDLVTLLKKKKPNKAGGCRLFVSTGSALFDNLTLAYLLGL